MSAQLVASAFIAALVSMALVWLRLRFAARGLDVPGERALHDKPVPHGGGVGIVLVMLLCSLWGAAGHAPLYALAAALALLAAVSLADDWRGGLAFVWRLLAHIGAAVLFVVFLLPLEALPVLSVLAVLVIVGTTNAYNFMDGADGLAGSMALVGFGLYALAFARADLVFFAVFCTAIAAAAGGFLVFNWHPARVFMGDVGSIPLGFAAGALGWFGVLRADWPLWLPLVAFAPFWGDASLTLVRRALRKERIWQAHREHCYQRQVRMGMSHAAMSTRWLLLMLVGAALAAVLLYAGAADTVLAWWLILIWFAVLALLAANTDRRWQRMQTKERV